jgi:hypothetical protein
MRASVLLTAAILGVLTLHEPVAADDVPIVAPRAPELREVVQTPGGTVTILRGGPPPTPTASQPSPDLGYGYGPTSAPYFGAGWDTGGFDDDYDTSGISPQVPLGLYPERP